MQNMKAAKRAQQRNDEDGETSRVVHAKVAPKGKTTPVAGIKRTGEHNRNKVETSETGIHEAMAEYWRFIFQMEWDEERATQATAREAAGRMNHAPRHLCHRRRAATRGGQ